MIRETLAWVGAFAISVGLVVGAATLLAWARWGTDVER